MVDVHVRFRWTALEALYFRKFSNASDVWSYAVLLFEVRRQSCQSALLVFTVIPFLFRSSIKGAYRTKARVTTK
jgi:hypothetical protein